MHDAEVRMFANVRVGWFFLTVGRHIFIQLISRHDISSPNKQYSIGTMARDRHSRKSLKRPILLLTGLWLSSPVASFLVVSPGRFSPSSSFPFHGILDRSEEDVTNVGGGVDFDSFNPLKPYKSGQIQNKRIQYVGTQVSLRQTSMQELTEKLLDVVGEKEETHALLVEYQEFLLEPLEDPDAVLVSIIGTLLWRCIVRVHLSH